MRNFILILALCLSVNTVFATQFECFDSIDPPSVISKKQKLKIKNNKARVLLYNSLNMSDAQVEKAETLHEKSISDNSEVFSQATKLKREILKLEKESAPSKELKAKKRQFKELKSLVSRRMKSLRKEFEALLTKEQRKKLKYIRAEKKLDKKLKLKNGVIKKKNDFWKI